MKTRVLVVIPANERAMAFVPQYEVAAETWIEFFGFDPDSPYLHVRQFPTQDAAEKFLSNPSIWKIGQHDGYLVREVVQITDVQFQLEPAPARTDSTATP